MLLLTGATGLLGGEWLPHLLQAKPDRPVIVLTRQREQLAILGLQRGVIALHADLSLSGLGVPEAEYCRLQREITEIIHCAADTRFGLPLEQARASNTIGTENLLKFARGCPRLQKFAHISTVYVAGRLTGDLYETPYPVKGFFNTYQRSKHESEEIALRAMSDLPLAIFRLSSLIGDSSTGYVRKFNYVHQLLRLLPRNVLPVIPGEPDAPVDLIATDWAVSALNHLFERRFVAGRIYHFCQGPQAALTVSAIMERTVQLFEKHPATQQHLPLPVPRLVSLSEFEAWMAEQQHGRDSLLKELLRVLGQFLPHFGLYQAFHNRHLQEGLTGSGLMPPPLPETFDKVVRYCLDTNWGRAYPKNAAQDNMSLPKR